jgi:molybdate transport system substrate-binding protein
MDQMMKIIQFVMGFLLIIFTVTGCGAFSPVVGPYSGPGNANSPTHTPALSENDKVSHGLIVFAAASLTGAFQHIGQSFEADNPGVQVSFNFAGSQILSTQLEQGAPADVFASADQKNMDLLISDQLVMADTVQQFATNSLVVILPARNPGEVTTLADLARPGLKLVLADASVPAGNYARQVLDKMSEDAVYGKDFITRVLANVVSNETDVKQVVTKVELGEADAGIAYTSDAVAAPELLTLPIPAKFNVIASYPIAILSNAPSAEMAKAFVNYVTSPAGQAILAKWGLNPANP